MTLSQSQDSLDGYSGGNGLYIGYDGTGIYNITGGGSSFAVLSVGYNSTANGTINLDDGSIFIWDLTYIGGGPQGTGGVGTFNQSGGEFTGGQGFYISPGSTYHLSGGHLNGALSSVIVYGTFNQTGGIFDYIGYGFTLTSTGVYNLTDGNFDSGSIGGRGFTVRSIRAEGFILTRIQV